MLKLGQGNTCSRRLLAVLTDGVYLKVRAWRSHHGVKYAAKACSAAKIAYSPTLYPAVGGASPHVCRIILISTTCNLIFLLDGASMVAYTCVSD